MSVLAIIPARRSSKGIPCKNWRPLGGIAPWARAANCAAQAGIPWECVVLSADMTTCTRTGDGGTVVAQARYLQRPPDLAHDDTPMIAVVQHVLQQIPGPPDQQIVLLQPTQPLRKPEHITQALALLTPEVDSVASVVEIPQTHAASNHAYLSTEGDGLLVQAWNLFTPTRRQDCGHSFIRDGTCYAFHRRTVTKHGNIYGELVRPLIIDPVDTCPLDTPQDWIEAERRLRERDAVPGKPPKEGSWPQGCVPRAFVEGARWWEFESTGATMWPSDREKAEVEAARRYGEVKP